MQTPGEHAITNQGLNQTTHLRCCRNHKNTLRQVRASRTEFPVFDDLMCGDVVYSYVRLRILVFYFSYGTLKELLEGTEEDLYICF